MHCHGYELASLYLCEFLSDYLKDSNNKTINTIPLIEAKMTPKDFDNCFLFFSAVVVEHGAK